MKKAIIALCVLSLLFLAACGSQTVNVEEDSSANVVEKTTNTAPKTTTETKTTTTKVASLDPAIKEQIEKDLIPGVKYVYPLNYKKMSYGDSYVFAIGLQNIINIDDDYLVRVTFDKAYDTYTNPITVDEDTMEKWVLAELDEFEIKQGESTIVEIPMKVKESSPGVRPVKGAYVFDLDVFQKNGDYTANDPVTGKLEITIKVQ